MEAALDTDRPVDVATLIGARVGNAYRLARAILGEPTEAEDVAQEACLTAWRKAGSIRDIERFDAWFDRIVVNLCRDQIRRRGRVRDVSPQWHGAAEGGSSALATSSDFDIDRALDELDVDHRIVVLLRYWQDRTVDDIARRLGIPKGTVKSRLHYALQRIRTNLEGSDGRA